MSTAWSWSRGGLEAGRHRCACNGPSGLSSGWVWEVRRKERNQEKGDLSVSFLHTPCSFLVFILPGAPELLPNYDHFFHVGFFSFGHSRALNPVLQNIGEEKIND